MDKLKQIRKSMWHGPLLSVEELEHIKNREYPENLSQNDEHELLLACVELMKCGDFSLKPRLIRLMSEAKNPEIQSASLLVFALVCNHHELQNRDNFAFLEEAEEDLAFDFIADSIFTYSYDVLPYLFMLLDEWDDTANEEHIRNSLDTILNYSDVMDYYASAEEIQEFASEVTAQSSADTYYYQGNPFFPNPILKKITSYAQKSLEQQCRFGVYVHSRIISLASGKLFPVEYGEIVDESSMQKINTYIEELNKFPWLEGAKYYYGNRIV